MKSPYAQISDYPEHSATTAMPSAYAKFNENETTKISIDLKPESKPINLLDDLKSTSLIIRTMRSASNFDEALRDLASYSHKDALNIHESRPSAFKLVKNNSASNLLKNRAKLSIPKYAASLDGDRGLDELTSHDRLKDFEVLNEILEENKRISLKLMNSINKRSDKTRLSNFKDFVAQNSGFEPENSRKHKENLFKSDNSYENFKMNGNFKNPECQNVAFESFNVKNPEFKNTDYRNSEFKNTENFKTNGNFQKFESRKTEYKNSELFKKTELKNQENSYDKFEEKPVAAPRMKKLLSSTVLSQQLSQLKRLYDAANENNDSDDSAKADEEVKLYLGNLSSSEEKSTELSGSWSRVKAKRNTYKQQYRSYKTEHNLLDEPKWTKKGSAYFELLSYFTHFVFFYSNHLRS